MKELVVGKNMVIFSLPEGDLCSMACIGREAHLYADSLSVDEVKSVLWQIKHNSLRECYFLDDNKVYVIKVDIDDLKLIFN